MAVAVLSTALGAWASFITISGALAGFVALVQGASLDAVQEQSHFGAVGGLPGGFFLAVAVVIVEVAT